MYLVDLAVIGLSLPLLAFSIPANGPQHAFVSPSRESVSSTSRFRSIWTPVQSTNRPATGDEIEVQEWLRKNGKWVEDVKDYPSGGKWDVSHLTLYEILDDCKPLSFFKYFVDNDTRTTDLLKDPSIDITLFGPTNDGFPPHHRRHGHNPHHGHDGDDGDKAFDLSVEGVHTLIADEQAKAASSPFHRADDEEDPDDRRHAIEKFIHKSVQYHILSTPLEVKKLVDNSSVATLSKAGDGSFDGQPRRLKVSTSMTFKGPQVSLNYGSRIITSDIQAKNGYLHVVSHPIFLPLSIITELLMVPQAFSTVTSALQQVHVAQGLLYNPHHGRDHDNHLQRRDVQDLVGIFGELLHTLASAMTNIVEDDDKDGDKEKIPLNPAAVTFLPPINSAWNRVPPRFIFYLFSPWGTHLLEKVLAYHAIPTHVIYGDWVHKVEHPYTKPSDIKESIEVFDDKVHLQYEVPTLLALLYPKSKLNLNLTIDVWSYRTFLGHGPRQVDIYAGGSKVWRGIQDIPARNGVIHGLSKVLHPQCHGGGHEFKDGDEWKVWMELLDEEEKETLQSWMEEDTPLNEIEAEMSRWRFH